MITMINQELKQLS